MKLFIESSSKNRSPFEEDTYITYRLYIIEELNPAVFLGEYETESEAEEAMKAINLYANVDRT